jgi:hypothetical protein
MADAVSPVRATVRAHRVPMPDGVAAVATLADPDGTYACEIVALDARARSAEAWARAVFEDAPRLLRSLIVFGWVAALRLKLGSRRLPTKVLGWTIVSATPDAVLLGVESPLLRAQLVVRVEDVTVVHATFVTFRNRLGRSLWAVAAPIHRRVIPYLLTRAATATD